MKKEYDFSKGKRGQFFHSDAKLNTPVYLDQDVKTWLSEKAQSRGVGLTMLINTLLRKDISIIQDVTGRG